MRGNKHSTRQIIYRAMAGMLAGLLCLSALLLIFSAFCLALQDPLPFVLPLCILSLTASALLVGAVCARLSDSGHVLSCCLICGAMLAAVLWATFGIIGRLLSADNMIPAFLSPLAIVPLTLLGIPLGLRPTKSRSHRPRRRKR